MRLLAIALLVAACTRPNPNVCCNDEADCNAKGIPVGSICEQGLVCRGNQCIAQPCANSAQCDPAAPYCIAELCAEACTEDAQCPGAGQAAGELFCVAGDCVTCRSSADCGTSAPVCDGGACRACVAHDECGSLVCEAGQCVPDTQVAYAAPTGSGTSSCTLASPCSLERAFAVVDSSRTTIRLLPGTYSTATTGWVFSGAFQLTVYGPATLNGYLQLNQPSSAAAMTVRLRDVTTHSVACDSGALFNPFPTIELDRVVIENAATGAGTINSNRCKLVVRNTRIKRTLPYGAAIAHLASNSTGEVAIVESSVIEVPEAGAGVTGQAITLQDGTSLQMRNSVVRGGSGANGAIVFGADVGPSTIAFSTFYNTTLKCPTGNLIVAAHDNIFLNELPGAPADTVSGNACSHRYSIVKPQAAPVPGSNNLVNMDPRFVNGANNDFHLVAGSPAIDAADPAATETTDLEGTARPQGAGRDIGAFEYKAM